MAFPALTRARHEAPVLLFALAAIVLTVLAPHYALAHTHRPRDAIAYYLREYNEKGQLVRAVKMYRGEVFFAYNYSYHGNGRLKSARVAGGRGSWSGTSAGARLRNAL